MLKQVTYIKAPFAGTVYKRLFKLAGEVYATPKEWHNHVVRFQAEGGEGWVIFGETAAVNLVGTDVSSLVGTVLTGVATSAPKNLVDRGYVDYYIGPNDKFFVVKGDTDNTGYWSGHVADFGKSVI